MTDKPEEAPPVVPGQILAGKFRIERVIGEGGMGVVAEATHLQLEQRVALKFLRREVMKLPDVVARFDREARASVKLKSEHVARVSDVGKTEDGIPFMVMEFLDGRDLAQVVAEQGPLPISEAVEYLIQTCEGVGEAHARGIVHRDLKPENLFLVAHGGWNMIKVLDFGISKAVLVGPSSVDLASHHTTAIMGSPYYMSPEQLRSTRTVDHRADIWSLGVVLFELLTGMTIFDETKEFTELVADILETPHRKLRAFRPDAPAELEAIVDKCLEKDRTRRYQNMAELAVALLPFAPRRARVTAERTTSMTRAAGLITDPNFQLPPSNYPPANQFSSSDSYPTGALKSPNLPSEVRANAETESPKPLDPAQSSPSLLAGVETTTTTARKQIPAALLIFAALALLGSGVALAYLVIRSLRPMQVVAQPTVSSMPDVGHVTVPVATATPTLTAETATATPTRTAPTTTRTHVTINQTPHPPPTTTIPATATTTAAPPHLDIQLTR